MAVALAEAPQLRVLLKAATTKDAVVTSSVLERAGIASQRCASVEAIVAALQEGAGVVLLAEEALNDPAASDLFRTLKQQPPWSDLPVLVLARQGADSRAVTAAMDLPANVTVLERPMRIASLISAVRSALRARRRQYELRTVLDGLREADQRKTEFLATLAHELRNPMAPLSTALSILTRTPPKPAEAPAYYALMERQVKHMTRLIDDLMEVSRVTRAQIDLQLEVLEINNVIADAIELSRPLIDAGKHRLEFHPPAQSSRVEGDRVRLVQVFSNLINNAAKYTPGGGVIRILVAKSTHSVEVSVSDNGAGIPPDMLESVFGMFVQIDRTTRMAQGGLGIGLTLVKHLVKLHHGSVTASSPGAGEGSCFTVCLPLTHAEIGARNPSLPPLPTRVRGNVLIVDDNRDAADSLSAALQLMGVATSVAYDGEQGLARAASVKPGIAILDIGMPRMDGLELARRLREDPLHDGIVLVALTGWGQSADRERVAAAGFDRHLLKPVDMMALTRIIEQHSADGAVWE
jgi:signal transduction histidine kinase/ActR/RegA family two-component response regulator